MGDAEPIEPGDRAEDRRAAVIDVVGETDRGDPGGLQRLAADFGIGEEALMLDRMSLRRLVKQALEIGEDQIRRAHFGAKPGERHAGIVDAHQIDIADQDQLGHARSPCIGAESAR